MVYLQKVLLIHLKKCVFYMIYKFSLPLRVSFKVTGVDRLKYVVVETVFPKDLFLPTVRIPFLGMMVQAPRNYMELLKRRYPYTWGWTFPYKWKCWVPFLS